MKKLLLLIVPIFSILGITFAQQAALEIIPKGSNPGQTVEQIASGGNVWKIYREKANSSMSLGDQFATGVMTWDTILDYAVYIMKFLGQLALLIGAVMLIYFGYQKAIASNKGTSSALLHLIIGILVVIFAYVIIRTIWYMFIA